MKSKIFITLGLLFSLNLNAQLLWENDYSTQDLLIGERGNSSRLSNGFVSTGAIVDTLSNRESAYILDLDVAGNIVFQTALGDNVHNFHGTDVIEVDSAAYVVVGYTTQAQSYPGVFDSACSVRDTYYNIFIAKIHPLNPIADWLYVFGDSTLDDKALSVIEDNGTYILTGYANGKYPRTSCPRNSTTHTAPSNMHFRDLLIARFSSRGGAMFISTYSDSTYLWGNTVFLDQMGNYVVAGTKQSLFVGTFIHPITTQVNNTGGVLTSLEYIQGMQDHRGITIGQYPAGSFFFSGHLVQGGLPFNTFVCELNNQLLAVNYDRLQYGATHDSFLIADVVIEEDTATVSGTINLFQSTSQDHQSSFRTTLTPGIGHTVVANTLRVYDQSKAKNKSLSIHDDNSDVVKYHLYGQSSPVVLLSNQVNTNNALFADCSDTAYIWLHDSIISTDSIDLIIDEIPLLDSFMRLPSNIMLVETCFNESSSRDSMPSSLVGIESKKVLNLRIYPNPTSGLIYVNMISGQENEVVIYNAFGEEVLRQNLTTKNNALDVSELPSGSYYIQLAGKGFGRFIKI